MSLGLGALAEPYYVGISFAGRESDCASQSRNWLILFNESGSFLGIGPRRGSIW